MRKCDFFPNLMKTMNPQIQEVQGIPNTNKIQTKLQQGIPQSNWIKPVIRKKNLKNSQRKTYCIQRNKSKEESRFLVGTL